MNRGVVIALTALLAGACSKSPEEKAAEEAPGYLTTEWPVARGSRFMSGSIADPVMPSVRIGWIFEAGSPISGDAAIYDDTVFVGSDDGVFFALDLETGKERWRFQTEDVIESEPALSGDGVFFGVNDGQFYGLNRHTGELLWKTEFQDKITGGANVVSSPLTGEAWLLVACNDGYLRCLLAKDGSEVWSYETDNIINGSPAMLDDKRIIFGGCDAFLHIVNLEDGQSIERYETEAYIPSSVAAYEGVGYSGNYANQVIAFDPGDRGELWMYEEKTSPFFSSPAVNSQFVFIGSRDKQLHAINRETGERVWSYKTAGKVDASPLAFSDAVVFGSDDGWIYAVDQADGTERWKLELGAAVIASPVFAKGKLVVGTEGGTLFALESRAGKR